MNYLLAILAMVAAVGDEVTATRLDGSVVTGPLSHWQDDRVTLVTPTGSVEVPTTELLSLEMRPAIEPASGNPIVELVDGSVIPVNSFRIDGQNARVQLASPELTTPHEIKIPIKQVRAMRLQPLDAALVPQWREIRVLESPSDVLIVLKREGKSLDYLEGVVEDVTSTEVAFKLDGDMVRVARAKVAGVIYYRANADDAHLPECILHGNDGLRVAAASVRAEDQSLRIRTLDGIEFTWPIAAITSADFSAGKVVFLSDLEPVTESWQPLIALPAAARYASRFGQSRMDRSAAGGPLTLAFPSDDQADSVGRLEKFAKGLALRSRSEFVVRLPSGYRRFLALAGIEPSTWSSGDVVLSIFGDDRLLMESPVVGNSSPVTVDVDVSDVKRLRIVVDYGDNLDTGDWLNLCNARIVK